ncbi:protein-cysteine N-palmitoyltransferase HHAT isoform X1 [Neodiprion pinetum]|uniref:Protein-cysteine N-palmitoyltransferase HHAT isoform X1 n=1 Tax=Neodiprion lecontei TaxID=441921 RepID=A0ABM3G011_NEOLC|nr:protein-cysteine N-palmitoyltransferase HHAT isoform X1 [Neodiprion pinetum]XP_046593609.1 protein-cysteine N-palmitoyltransferase HHAT isoform X1 [Neodiprion lecontei]
MKRSVALNGLELWIYFCGWTGGIIIGMYHLYLHSSSYFRYYDDVYGDFSPGWKWIGGKRDTADPEWRIWIPLLYRILPWACVQIFIGQIVKYFFSSMLLCCWYIVISLTFLWSFVGSPAIIFLLIHPTLAWLLVPLRSKIILWTLHVSCLVVLNAVKSTDCIVQKWLELEEDEYNVLTVALAWMQLKSIGFSFDNMAKYRCKSFDESFEEFVQILAYCLYLPTLFLGQLILYNDFVNGINTLYEKWTFKRVTSLILGLFRYLFWIFFTEFSLHFLYINILHFHSELLHSFNSWALYGFGYCMGQYFLNKYVVVYGFSRVIARAENIADLYTPKCIARIHLYSDMWKYFDRGLHNFLLRYIYLPVAGTKSALQKVFASFLCFSLVYVWHGTQMFILTWSVLNFIGVTIESLARTIGSTKIYIETQRKVMGPTNARRFHCILASPLLAMSAISNFYFFGGQEIGNIFVRRILGELSVCYPLVDSWKSFVTLLSVLYCCCQLSTELKIRDTKKSQPVKSD